MSVHPLPDFIVDFAPLKSSQCFFFFFFPFQKLPRTGTNSPCGELWILGPRFSPKYLFWVSLCCTRRVELLENPFFFPGSCPCSLKTRSRLPQSLTQIQALPEGKMNGKTPKSHPAPYGHDLSGLKCPFQPFPPEAAGFQQLKLQRFARKCKGLCGGECSWFIQKRFGGFERKIPGKIEWIQPCAGQLCPLALVL